MIAISIGHNVEGVPTHTHTHVLEVFAGLMPAYGIDGYSAYEVEGCYKGEFESPTKYEYARQVARRLLDGWPAYGLEDPAPGAGVFACAA